MIRHRIARGVASRLERGDGPPAAVLRALWEAAARRSLRRPLPGCGAHVVSVMGATLGGSWKTPVAIALAARLTERGILVGFLSHGYRASDRSTRAVTDDDSPGEVGDEAWMSARALGKLGVVVVAGGDLAAGLARLGAREVVVVDGCARAPQRREHTAILAVDAERPWGSGATPPEGDLEARSGDLLRASSRVVAVHDALGEPPPLPPELRDALRASFDLGGLEALEGMRVALVTALARPDRVARALALRGVNVVHHVALADHGGAWAEAEAIRSLAIAPPFDAVATTEKCGAWLPHVLVGRPVHRVALHVTLPAELAHFLGPLSGRRGAAMLHVSCD